MHKSNDPQPNTLHHYHHQVCSSNQPPSWLIYSQWFVTDSKRAQQSRYTYCPAKEGKKTLIFCWGIYSFHSFTHCGIVWLTSCTVKLFMLYIHTEAFISQSMCEMMSRAPRTPLFRNAFAVEWSCYVTDIIQSYSCSKLLKSGHY